MERDFPRVYSSSDESTSEHEFGVGAPPTASGAFLASQSAPPRMEDRPLRPMQTDYYSMLNQLEDYVDESELEFLSDEIVSFLAFGSLSPYTRALASS